MSEKIYAWLLRLYPSRFRRAYGDEALQLFRDRARDERGFLPRLRLWLDLLVDIALSVPHEHRRAQLALAAASVEYRSDGLPSFRILEDGQLRLGTLLFGSVLAFAALSAFVVLIRDSGHRRPPRAAAIQSSVPKQTPPAARRNPAEEPADHARTADDVTLDATERRRVVDGVVANLKQHYIDPKVAQKIAEALQAHDQSGDDNAATDGAAFAALLTRQLRDVSHDMHLAVVYSRNPLPEHPGPTPERLAQYRKAMEQDNCTFEKVAILPHNIGYLKLNSFPDPAICQSTAMAAMASLNHADAIIFDLRDNTGGSPDMVMLIAAYLFDHPEYMYNPRENTTERSWTRSPVPTSRLADKPVFVLTSAKTLSGAEHFSYDLKMLKRVTLVGETTGGSAHSGVFYRIDDHFGIGIPETRAINPFATADWEGKGVEPDVKVESAAALETAKRLAETRLSKK
jgi:Peptidase family S41/N-terminal domain of Peptidase_S41 in eukaryotic IRBP